MIPELNDRSRQVFQRVIEAYIETGEPVGSRTVSKILGLGLSPATIRNVMADLEESGLLYAPHVSAGRLPTQSGLRLYVDGLMQSGPLSADVRNSIDQACAVSSRSVEDLYDRAGAVLSGLSRSAGLVVAPKTDPALRQIQFVRLDSEKVLAILVSEKGAVENRIMDVPPDLPPAALVEAANYLNARIQGRTLAQTREAVRLDIEERKTQLDELTQNLVERGLALPASGRGYLIVRGQSRLLEDVRAIEDLERARHLFARLEEEETMLRILEAAGTADGVQIFIGTENAIFNHSGWSMVISPCRTEENLIVGAIGVIGPARLNYGKIIPIVDYTAQVMGRLSGV